MNDKETAQWRCINEECPRKNTCSVYMNDYETYQPGWVKFFKAFPCGENCYHWKFKEKVNGNDQEDSL